MCIQVSPRWEGALGVAGVPTVPLLGSRARLARPPAPLRSRA